MNSPSNTPQDYGHPDSNPDDDQMSKNAERDQPADPRLDPNVSEDPGLNKRDGIEARGDKEGENPASLS